MSNGLGTQELPEAVPHLPIPSSPHPLRRSERRHPTQQLEPLVRQRFPYGRHVAHGQPISVASFGLLKAQPPFAQLFLDGVS